MTQTGGVDGWLVVASLGTVLVSVIVSYLVSRRARRIELDRHWDAVSNQIANDGFNNSIQRGVLNELAVALLVEYEIGRISDLTFEEFLDELREANQYDHTWPHDRIVEVLKGVFSKDNVKKVGKEVIAKLIAIANKAAGLG